MERTADKIRRDVADSYAEAVRGTMPENGVDCCGGTKDRKGAVVGLAGYSPDELKDLPSEAVVNSFGCGNPVALAGLAPGDVVLDLGSGAGIDLLLAANRVGPSGRVIGVDMTDDMISKANENIRAANATNVEVRKGIIEELPVESDSVDWVISNCVINLSPEKPRVFREIARVLKPGGRMLVSDMVATDLPEEVREAADLYSSCISGAIGEDEYLAELRKAGLVDVEVRARLVYDSTQLRGVAQDMVETFGLGEMDARVSRWVDDLEGKVWSAKVYARKPE